MHTREVPDFQGLHKKLELRFFLKHFFRNTVLTSKSIKQENSKYVSFLKKTFVSKNFC